MNETPVLPEWRELNIDGFIGLIGPLLSLREADGSLAYGLKTTVHHQNPMGLIHGGVITSLFDQAIALTAWKAADRRPTVTVQMDVQFLKAAKPGDFLQTQTTIHHSTRQLMFIDAQMHCENTPIARASAIMKISNKTD